ncbi:hypothetical protein [Paenarthrobacter sp. NPDC090522]|uniref:hypothetical protein n=1 Tax=Paenarthrobacter sp. NPDC090522 TaxID=3364383 RepID=UPI0038164FC0
MTKSAKRTYYASDFGILPKAYMPTHQVGDRKYSRGKLGEPNVQAVGSAPGTAAIDQSDEINAFLSQISSLGGGIAIFEGDASQLTGYGVKKPIVMLPDVAIWGLGWNKTTFFLLDGANCSVFVNSPGQSSNYQALRDLRINGNRWGQDFGVLDYATPGAAIGDLTKHPADANNWQFNSHGILMVPDYKNPLATAGGDTYAHFENIYVVNPYGSAAMTSKIGGEIRFRNIVSQGAGGNGFQAGFDTFLSDVTVAVSEHHGFLQANGSTRFSNTKAFWCGQVFERWQVGGGSINTRRASAGYKIVGGTCEFASSEAQNCGGEGFLFVDAESVNGQISAFANNMLADSDTRSNPAKLPGIPYDYVNDAVWTNKASKPAPTPENYPGVRLNGKSRYNNLVITSRTAGLQGSGPLGQQAYALGLDAANGTVKNNISVTHSDGYDGKRIKGILTSVLNGDIGETIQARDVHSAIVNNWIVADGKAMSDAVRQAPDDLFTIDVPGTYIAMGSGDMQGTVANTKYRNHPFAGGMVRIICSEFNGHLAMEAIRLDEAVAPFTSIKFVTDANWQAWTKRSRA